MDGKIPAALDLPTGLGKTSVMAIWLIALAEQAAAGAVRLPWRLVYVVDRRTVVDQATEETHTIRLSDTTVGPSRRRFSIRGNQTLG
ncbi:MAG TPA: DEAD/DEAH box helicase family protein [Stellaceae bacterium]